jgi:protein subunit release factor A
MYTKFAERRRWKVDILSQNITGLKGAKEIIASIEIRPPKIAVIFRFNKKAIFPFHRRMMR